STLGPNVTSPKSRSSSQSSHRNALTWPKRDLPRTKASQGSSPRLQACHVWLMLLAWPNMTFQGAREGQQASPTITFGPRFQSGPNVTHSLTKLSKPTKRDSNVTPQKAPKLKPSLSKVTFGPSSRPDLAQT
ncbi:hypothetical protein PIB30_095665, partial [Stylosanthes scabra]|nr:hypothetical protein [Stylosanthes scabra]